MSCQKATFGILYTKNVHILYFHAEKRYTFWNFTHKKCSHLIISYNKKGISRPRKVLILDFHTYKSTFSNLMHTIGSHFGISLTKMSIFWYFCVAYEMCGIKFTYIIWSRYDSNIWCVIASLFYLIYLP